MAEQVDEHELVHTYLHISLVVHDIAIAQKLREGRRDRKGALHATKPRRVKHTLLDVESTIQMLLGQILKGRARLR